MTRTLLLVVVLAGLGACSQTTEDQPCGPNTCSGCCEFGACVAGTTDETCGPPGSFCQRCLVTGARCLNRACVGGVSQKPDAGTQQDAGTASSDLFVTMRYDYVESGGGTCPNLIRTVKTCSAVKRMSKAKFDALRVDYAACDVTQQSADGWLIDCAGHCTPVTRDCGTSGTYQDYVCMTPKYGTAGACFWDPP